MKYAIALALLLCLAFSPALPAQTARVEKTTFFGKEYARLDQWARANNLQARWTARNEVQLSNQSWRLVFTTDSRRMTLNGVTVLLSEIIRVQNGVPYVATLDLNTALHPVMFPAKNSRRSQIRHICIDPGHGGRDPGKQDGSNQEKRYTLLLALELGAQLRKLGYSVSYTRTSDTFVDLPVRADLARRRGADLLLSLHFNSAGRVSTEIGGVEVYCMTPQRAASTNARGEGATAYAYAGNLNNSKNMLLAHEMQKAIVRGTGLEDRGVKRGRLQVLCEATMPAVLIEGGFMTNPTEARKIYNAAWRQRLATSIVNGVQSYKRLVEP